MWLFSFQDVNLEKLREIKRMPCQVDYWKLFLTVVSWIKTSTSDCEDRKRRKAKSVFSREREKICRTAGISPTDQLK